MPGNRAHWESRYAEADRKPGTASPFVTSLLPLLPVGRALDLACGTGRHALALARGGHWVVAIDQAFNGLTRLQRAAAAERLEVHPIQADLRQLPLPGDYFDVVLMTFYLERELFDAVKHTLRPGGVAVLETFTIDQREIGHPRNPKFLLDRGELAAAFSDFEVLRNEEGLFDLGGEKAYVARLAARKPAADRGTRH